MCFVTGLLDAPLALLAQLAKCSQESFFADEKIACDRELKTDRDSKSVESSTFAVRAKEVHTSVEEFMLSPVATEVASLGNYTRRVLFYSSLHFFLR